MLATLLGRAIGFLKEVLVTRQYGTSWEMDAFVIALIFPTLLAQLAGGAIQVSLVPVYIEWRLRKGEDKATKLLSTTITSAAFLFAILTLFLYLVAPRVVPWLGLGFNSATRLLSIQLARLMAPLLLLQAAIVVLVAVLNAHQIFALPSLAPIVISITIMSFLVFGGSMGISALAWGTLFGFLACLFILSYGLIREGIRYRPRLDFKDLGVQRVAALSWPMFLGSALAHANIYVDQAMASWLKTGSVAALNYANKLFEIPSQIFIVALSTAVFPFFSQQTAEGDFAGLRDSFMKSVRMAAFILLPLSALMVALAHPLVKVLFQRGAFDEQATLMTSQALAFYALGIFPLAYAFINGRAFIALQDTRTLRNVALLNLFLNAGLNLIFMQFWAHAGIALSTSVTYVISGLILYRKLARKWKVHYATTGLGKSFCKMMFTAILCAIGSAATYGIINRVAWSPVVGILTAVVVGGILYYASARGLQIEELSLVWTYSTRAMTKQWERFQGG